MNLFDFALYYYSKERHAKLSKGQETDHFIPYSKVFALIKNSTRSIRKRFFLLRIWKVILDK